MNRALLRKDIGLLKDMIYAAIALLLISYGFAGILVFTEDSNAFSWSKVLAGGASLVRFTSILISALLGGHAYGREREEKSIEFLAQLPVHPRTAILCKLVVAAGILALLWLISLTLLWIGLGSMGHDTNTRLAVLEAMLSSLAAGLLVFGAAWLASFVITSALGASFVGLMILLPALALQYAAKQSLGPDNLTALVMAVLGCTCIGIPLWFDLQHMRDFSRTKHRNIPAREFTGSVFPEFMSSLHAIAWKDVQLMKVPLLVGVVVLIAPYIAGCVGWPLLDNKFEFFRAASLLCMAMSVIVFPFWAAHIMSVEYTGKTAGFSSYLPILNRDAIAGKLIVALGPVAVLAIVNLIVLLATHNSIPGSTPFGRSFSWNDWNQSGFIVMGLALANATPLAFALAWMLGARIRRPAMALTAGIAIVPFLVAVWASTSAAVSIDNTRLSPLFFTVLFGLCSVCLGMVGLVRGITISANPYQQDEFR